MTTDIQETLGQDQLFLQTFINAGVKYIEARSSEREDMGCNLSLDRFMTKGVNPYFFDKDLLKRVPGAVPKKIGGLTKPDRNAKVKIIKDPNYTPRMVASMSEATEDWIDMIDYIQSWYKNIGRPFRLHIIEPYKLEYL